MVIIESHIVPKKIPKVRFLDYSVEIIKSLRSRSSIKKAIKRGELLLNGETVPGGTWIEPGQKIELIDNENKPPKPYELNLEIIFEDESLAIINKPAGISVSGNKYRTIQNALLANLRTSSEPDSLKWPRPVHRLDYATSGLLLIAKTSSALVSLGKQFEERRIKKSYKAIVIGKVNNKGVITEKINDKEAITGFKLITHIRSLYTDWLSLVEILPETGRTHQIRIHMEKIGHPVLGDNKYGKEHKLLKGKGLFLAAVGLMLHHPKSNESLTFSIDIPYKFTRRLQTEQRRWEKYHKF